MFQKNSKAPMNQLTAGSVKAKILSFICIAAIMTIACAFPVCAATFDTTTITDSIKNFGEILRNFASPVMFILIIIGGLGMIGGGQQGRQWAKPTLLFGAIGFVIVMFAPTILGLIENAAPRS